MKEFYWWCWNKQIDIKINKVVKIKYNSSFYTLNINLIQMENGYSEEKLFLHKQKVNQSEISIRPQSILVCNFI